VEEILREVDSYRPDLLVIRTQGWTGLKLLGSVTENLMCLCPVPVLTTRGAPKS
jgi:nucleotide-binding universal stress UspA family protein